MKNFVCPHCHPQSLDSASTVPVMVEREVELGTGYVTATDHGTMAAALEVYGTARKKGLKPILGLEAYFRDDDCEILKAAGIADAKAYNKYYHVTMHFLDQEAYETACRILSDRCTDRSEVHGGEAKALFNWSDLRELGSKNVTMGSSCLVGMVARHLMSKRPDLAVKYYHALKASVKPGNFYVEVFPHRCTHNWENNVRITLAGAGEQMKMWLGKKICVNGKVYSAEAYAAHLARAKKDPGPQVLEYVLDNKVKREIGREIEKAEKLRDFIQNECTPLMPDGDLQLLANKFVLGMAQREGDPVLISDDAHFAHPEQKIVQDARLGNGSEMWKFYNNYHRLETEEAVEYFQESLGIDTETVEKWVENSYAWAGRFDKFELKFDVSLPQKFYTATDGEDTTTLVRTKKLIDRHGRMDWKNPAMLDRLKREIEILHNNGKIDLLPYFFPLEEVCALYRENGMLTGPGRGSAAGLLLAYLLGITHVDPLKHSLSLERFITKERILQNTLPDIDQDLEDRELLVGADGNSGWLRERFGDHVAQISTDSSMRLKSSIRDVHRFREGFVSQEIEDLCRKLPVPPQGISDHDYVFGYSDDDGNQIDGVSETNPTVRKYIECYPEEWRIVAQMLGITRQKSRHACAYVIADRPIKEFIPLTKISDVVVTQFTAKWVEMAGGVKIDFLVVNSLKDIRVCLELIRSRRGIDLDPWKLPEDQVVFNDICEGQTETVFQLNTSGAVGYLKLFDYYAEIPKAGRTPVKGIASIDDIAIFTSLDRPGPLDFKDPLTKRNMLQEYAARKRKESRPDVPVLAALLPETHGVIVYQEQLMRVAQEIGGMTPTQANEFRGYVAKKKKVELMQMKALFLEGALKKLDGDTAERLWDMMVTFGQYGFNASHAVSYSYIAYACAYLKHHYPLEWWCSVLRNAKKNEVAERFWKHCGHLVSLPDINTSTDNFSLPAAPVEGEKILAPILLLDGIGEATHNELCAKRPFANIEDFVKKTDPRLINKGISCKLIASGVMDSLFPEGDGILDKLMAYMIARAKIRDEKQEPVPEQFVGLSPLRRYALQKSILAICEGSATEMVLRDPPRGMSVPENGRAEYNRSGKKYPVVRGSEFERLAEMEISAPVHCAAVGYVISERRFAYKNKQAEAVELVLDVDGVIFSTVKWPDRETGELKAPENMAKSVALVALSRYKTDRPFYVDDIVLLV